MKFGVFTKKNSNFWRLQRILQRLADVDESQLATSASRCGYRLLLAASRPPPARIPPRYRPPPARIPPRQRAARLPPPYRRTIAANAGGSGAVAAATAGRWIHRPPLPSRPPPAPLPPPAGRYRPAYSPRWHQPKRHGF